MRREDGCRVNKDDEEENGMEEEEEDESEDEGAVEEEEGGEGEVPERAAVWKVEGGGCRLLFVLEVGWRGELL